MEQDCDNINVDVNNYSNDNSGGIQYLQSFSCFYCNIMGSNNNNYYLVFSFLKEKYDEIKYTLVAIN